MPLKDPRNHISLHKNIELALDTGKIAIVPSLISKDSETKWRCVLVDKNASEEVVFITQQGLSSTLPPLVRWKVSGSSCQFMYNVLGPF